MCGIAGYLGRRQLSVNAVEAIFASLAARGPDARGDVAFGGDWLRTDNDGAPNRLIHTRLAIRDLTEAGAQPMGSADGQVWLVYNGEVYGWERDADTLTAAGHPLRSRSDTEFILNGYLAWGLDALLPKLRGMFAFAILDLRTRNLHLVRDRLGIKPLVYFHRDGELAFGSLLRAVLPYLRAEERSLSPAAIDAFLAHRYIPAPMTVLAGVRRLPAAHRARFDLDSGVLSVHEYWRPEAPGSALPLAERIREAVDLRLVADRPVGLFLSGGIDSSVLASNLADLGRDDIASFTAAFPGTDFDESDQAARIATHLGLPNTAMPIEPRIGEDFERLIADLDEPFADPSAIPLWYLSRATVEHVPVVLGGDGGDELFAGYKRYVKHLRNAWRGGFRLPLPGYRGDALPGRNAKLADELRMSWIEAYALRFSGMAPSLRRWLQPDLDTQPMVHWRLPAELPRNPLKAMLEVDRLNYLPEYILRKSDLCTASHGLEARVPLLDHRLYGEVQAMADADRFTQPAKLAMAPACRACTDLDLFNTPKRGFNPPIGTYLRGPLASALSNLPTALERTTDGQIPAIRSAALLDAFTHGGGGLAEQVWQLLSLRASLEQIRATP